MNIKIKDNHLFPLLDKQLSKGGREWLRNAVKQIASKQGENENQLECFIRLSAMAKRKLGSESIEKVVNLVIWRVDEAARLMLLATLLENSPVQNMIDNVKKAFRYGDETEQVAIMKSLDTVDEHGELVDLAISNGRTNSSTLFSAIALNNCYPSKHYDTKAFYQLVLKALFMDLDISQVIGLKQRLCPELTHLAMDLIKERVAANRRPPESIAYAINISDLGADDLEKYNIFVNKECSRNKPVRAPLLVELALGNET